MAQLPCIGLYKPYIHLPFGDVDRHVLWPWASLSRSPVSGHPGSPQRKLPRGDGEITYSKPCARSYGKISHVSYGFWTIKQYWWCCWWKEMQLFVRLRCGLKNTKGIDQGFKEDEKCESPRWIVYVDIIKYVHIYIYTERERERSTYTYK